MDWTLLLRWLHVIGATVLFGTGSGIAFFMVMAVRTRDPKLIAHVASSVVRADLLFTASAVVIQPITGTLLALSLGWPLTEGWIVAALALYVLTGVFWLPVVRLQARMRDIARDCVATGAALPEVFFGLYRGWLIRGFPAFASVATILWLMLARPDIALPF